MATVLYLNDTQVYPDGQQSIKLTRENPYFTQSDSYTLDVTLPMDILENRSFFKNVNRMECSKKVQTWTCRLLADNRLLLSGTARLTQVTEKEVKVQLLGGNSEINFLSEDSNTFIDNLDLGEIKAERASSNATDFTYRTTTDIRFRESDVYDETAETRKSCFQFCLIDIIRQIFRVFGFEMAECSIDKTPWNCLYVASAKSTYIISHVLPHWTPKTLITEMERFFNVTVIVNQELRTVIIRDNPTFFNTQDIVSIDPVDEYSVEMNTEADTHALAADNLRFDMSSSDHHDYDVIPDNVRENAPSDSYTTKALVESAWNAASEDDKTGKIYDCPTGKFTGWTHDYTDIGGDEEKLLLTQIDVFAPLIRDGQNGNETELKICPVAIGEIEYEYEGTRSLGNYTYTDRWKEHIPSMENPTGNDRAVGRSGGNRSSAENSQYEATIQEFVTGEADIEKKEKEDRLQVMFMDDVKQPCYYHNGIRNTDEELAVDIGFTDYQFKKAHKDGVMHSPWSLSLNRCEATYYLGQLHENGFTFNVKAKHCINFLADKIPDPKSVFIIRAKRYGCEKIEAQIDSQGMQRLMTGYFYEMT